MKRVEEERKLTMQQAKNILSHDYPQMIKALDTAWKEISDEHRATARRAVRDFEVRCEAFSEKVRPIKDRIRLEMAQYDANIAQYGDPLDRLRRTHEEWFFCNQLEAARKHLLKDMVLALTETELRGLLHELKLRNMFYEAMEKDSMLRNILFAGDKAAGAEVPSLALWDAVLERMGYYDIRLSPMLYAVIDAKEEKSTT